MPKKILKQKKEAKLTPKFITKLVRKEKKPINVNLRVQRARRSTEKNIKKSWWRSSKK